MKEDKIRFWPTSGRKCYITPAFSGIPKQRGTKSEFGHKWAEMLHNPCVLGDPQMKEDKIRFWPTSGRKCYINPAFSGIPK